MLKKLYLMQDDAAPYTVISSKYVLSDIFQDRLIGKVFSIIWPPYSPDLTPIDFWLWPKLKAIIFSKRHKPLTSVWGLKLAIMHAFRRLQSKNSDHVVPSVLRTSSCFAKMVIDYKILLMGNIKCRTICNISGVKNTLLKYVMGLFLDTGTRAIT